MKPNFKDCPVYRSYNASHDELYAELLEWYEWSDSLKERLIGQITSGSPKAHLKNQLIKEILGE